MNWLARIADKAGSFGAVIATMGCAMCFPAVAGLGVAIGLGFLSQWESLFVNTLLPLFAWLVLGANLLGWFAHRQWHRSALGVLGPILLLLSLYPWFQYGWSSYVTYSALILMVGVSLWDVFAPANRHCEIPSSSKEV